MNSSSFKGNSIHTLGRGSLGKINAKFPYASPTKQGSGDNRWCLSSDGMYGNQSAMQGSLMFSGYIVNNNERYLDILVLFHLDIM